MHKKGYYFYTHDFVDQTYSVYYWLRDEIKKDQILSIFLDKGQFQFENFFDRDIILTRIGDLLPWFQEYENDNIFLETIEVLLPNLKESSRYISKFQYLDYKGEIYRL